MHWTYAQLHQKYFYFTLTYFLTKSLIVNQRQRLKMKKKRIFQRKICAILRKRNT